MTNLTTKQKKAKERMTDQEILQKAIEKALENGYRPKQFIDLGWYVDVDLKIVYSDDDPEDIISYQEIIFSHDFAKAFWGDKNTDYAISCMGINRMPFLVSWQYHLTQMVLEPDPIKYLEKFL